MTDWHHLIRQCKLRDPRAQRELYDQFKARLMGVCRRYASSREEGQDILQESFIKIFSKIDQLDSVEKLGGWMMRITINTAVSHYHDNKPYNFQKDVATAQIENNDYEILLSDVSDEYLVKMINDLPDGCRMVFNLNVVEGYSHVEIASMLMISESTSRSQLTYAKSLLKAKLTTAGIKRYEKYG